MIRIRNTRNIGGTVHLRRTYIPLLNSTFTRIVHKSIQFYLALTVPLTIKKLPGMVKRDYYDPD